LLNEHNTCVSGRNHYQKGRQQSNLCNYEPDSNTQTGQSTRFYTPTSETRERIGHIRMRQLVYRVQPLVLVWDLEVMAERSYIKQFVDGIVANPKERKPELTLIMDVLVKLCEHRRHLWLFAALFNWFLFKPHLITFSSPPSQLNLYSCSLFRYHPIA
jgi:hypothetical protein